MITLRVLTILLFCFFTRISGQEFTNQQKAWLYKVVEKSPCLKSNLSQYFNYTGKCQNYSISPFLSEKEKLAYQASLWDSIEYSIIYHPELLYIDFEGVKTTSPGVIAELSVKLTLWEIYSNLKTGYQEEPKFSDNVMAKDIYSKAISFLPSEMKLGSIIKPKYESAILELINPSLNFNRKLKAFSQIKKIEVSQQKLFFEKWYSLIHKLVEENSLKYFNQLIDREVYFNGELLAVGDGSGSSGLLREFEEVNDKNTDTGTGKGIGLFTYKVAVKKGKVELESTTETTILLLKDEPTLLHLSLWGMDWSKKPLVVIERGDKSYLLYGNQDFSPDPNWSKGTSYFDMLNEFQERKIDHVLIELNKEGGLLSVYEREAKVRDKIQNQIEQLNIEIDSIKDSEDPNQSAIQQRLNKNEVNLSNLSSKEERLSTIQKKITAEYQKVESAEKELNKMKSVLGKNIQDWSMTDSVFTFTDGTIFNAETQDFILFNDSTNENKINVRLLAATYSIYSDKKDEVQLYVNITGGVNDSDKQVSVPVTSDTLIMKSVFFEPDEFNVNHLFDDREKALLNKLKEDIQSKNVVLQNSFIAMGVDTINHVSIARDRIHYNTKKNETKYINSRRVDILVVKKENDYSISIKGYTDAGATKLSNVSVDLKKVLKQFNNDEQTLNPALSILRILSVIKEIEIFSGLSFSESEIEVPVLKEKIKIDKIK